MMSFSLILGIFLIDKIRSKKWINVPTYGIVPGPRGGHSAILHGTTMWVFGGWSLNTYLNELYSLNLETVFNNLNI